MSSVLGGLVRFVSVARIYVRMLFLIALGRPYKLTLLVSGGCNLRCQICSIWRDAKTTITVADVEQIWQAFRFKPCWVNVSGGEPTLNAELEAILGFFAEMRRPLLITLTTNGYADCTALIQRILQRSVQTTLYVSVSIDGPESTHNLARGRSRSYQRAMDTYTRLRGLRPEFPHLKVGVSTTISAVNMSRILPFLSDLLEREVALTVNLAQASEYYRNSESDHFEHLPRAELITLLKAIQRLLPKFSLDALLKLSFLEGVVRQLEGRYQPLPCASTVNNVLVTSELDLVNCTLLFQPWVDKRAARAAKLAAIVEAVKHPAPRKRALAAQIRESGCERTCHTPCETYVHTIAALVHPRFAPRIFWSYLRVCLGSLFFRRRALSRALSRLPSAGPSRESTLRV